MLVLGIILRGNHADVINRVRANRVGDKNLTLECAIVGILTRKTVDLVLQIVPARRRVHAMYR